MFENLIWGLVEYYAHKYLRNFSTEVKEVDWWNGKVAMDNVELNAKEIAELNLPIRVKSGYIYKISIEIPWKRILSDPVRVYVEGIEVRQTKKHIYL